MPTPEYMYAGYAVDLTELSIEDIMYFDLKVEGIYNLIRIPVLEVLPFSRFHLKGKWKISTFNSVSHMESYMIDTPHRLTYGQVYYSLEEESCKRFVSNIRKKNNEYIDKLRKLRSSRVLGVEEYDNNQEVKWK